MVQRRRVVAWGWYVLLVGVGLLGWGLLSVGCGPKACKTALDCGGAKVCLNGTCQDPPDGTVTENPAENPSGPDDGGTTGKDGAPDTPPTEQPRDRQPEIGPGDTTDGGPGEIAPELPPGPQVGELVINEVLFDPAAGLDGDANGDGTRDSSDDEFVEIVNTTASPLNVSGVILDVDGKTYTVPNGTVLPPLTALVVFGGGMNGDTEVNTGQPHAKFGGALVFNQDLPTLTNGGGTLKLMTADKQVLDTFSYGTQDCPGGGSVDQSVTRNPDLTGTCALHLDASGQLARFSPGTRSKGGKFSDPPPEPPPAELPAEVVADGGETVQESAPPETKPEVVAETSPEPVAETQPDTPVGQTPAVGDLVINELHTDPDTSKGDANGDGQVSAIEDEFIEIVNKGSSAIQMKGVEVSIKTTVVYTFKSLVLQPKEAVVLFRGGLANDPLVGSNKPHTKFGNAYVFLYDRSTALNNTGTVDVTLKLGATTLDTFSYGTSACPGDADQSIIRSPELTTGTCKIHSDVDPNKSLFSPGRRADGTAF